MSLDPGLPVFYAVELDCYQPASGSSADAPGYSTQPWSVMGDLTIPAASMTIRASDTGYRTKESGGVVNVYPPLLAQAFSIQRAMNLDPTQSAAAAAWGSLS